VPIFVKLYAKRNSCRSSDLVVGQRVALLIQERDAGYRIRDAVAMGGCHLYNDGVGQDVIDSINSSTYMIIFYFLFCSLLSLGISVFCWWRCRS
jgi:hypothetical protein